MTEADFSTAQSVLPSPRKSAEQAAASARADGPVVGHEWAVQFLANLTSGLRHAYLFLGPSHIGKTTLATWFAQSLLCTGGPGRPCGTCRACGLMARGTHPDFRLVQPTATDGEVDRTNGLLRSGAAEEIVRDAALHPLEGRYKIFLIQDFHQANSTFSNKLLKTLEEPPANVIVCITAVDRALLLPTIVSRCQTLELRPTPRATLYQALVERYGVEQPRADLLSRLANGRMGWALEQLAARDEDERTTQLETLWNLITGNSVARLDWAEKLATNRNNVHLFGLLELWVNWWRDVMLYQAGSADACNNIDQLPRIQQCADAVPAVEIRDYLATLQRIEGYLHHTVNTRLALDVLVMRLPTVDVEG